MNWQRNGNHESTLLDRDGEIVGMARIGAVGMVRAWNWTAYKRDGKRVRGTATGRVGAEQAVERELAKEAVT